MLQTKYYVSRALSFALVLMVAWGCSTAATEIDANFDMPTGLTVAGTTGQRLFIANSGEAALQVIELGEDLASLDPVEGPSFYFPLRIPGGPAPEEIASTEDGRFVVVLNWVTNKLHIIDADTLDNAFMDGVEVEIDLSKFMELLQEQSRLKDRIRELEDEGTKNPHQKWIFLAQAVDSWRIFPRAFLSIYMFLLQIPNYSM